MNTTVLHIVSKKHYDDYGVESSEKVCSEMSSIGLCVLENEDDSMVDLTKRQLNELSENGCEINLEKKSFFVSDINLFTEYMLDTKFSGWPSPEAAPLGKLIHDVTNNYYLNFPTFYDGEAYDSLFEALRRSLFSDENDRREYVLAGVYDGLY